MTPAPIRIDLWRGVRAFLFTLALPMSLAVAADLLTGSLPWLTIAAVLICIPLATIVVNRTVLGELDRIVSLVAPKESDDSLESQDSPEADDSEGPQEQQKISPL